MDGRTKKKERIGGKLRDEWNEETSG